MRAYLAYRFPNEEISINYGRLSSFQEGKHTDGFVISDYSCKNKWFFQSDDVHEPVQVVAGEFPFVMDADAYEKAANQVIDDLKDGQVSKVVLSRIKKMTLSSTDYDAYFQRLCESLPSAFVYLLISEETGVWLGASPELLLDVQKGKARTMSLAGTRLTTESRDWTEKEHKEQRLVTEFIKNVIIDTCDVAPEMIGPAETIAGPVRHLKTEFQFTIDNPKIFEFLHALHPTPAVCGFPIETAQKTIEKTERHSRELYGGYLGRFTKEKVTLYVNLRCCKFLGNEAFLFLGGGYTDQSDPKDEWIETENKSLTLSEIFKGGK